MFDCGDFARMVAPHAKPLQYAGGKASPKLLHDVFVSPDCA
jgi:hypothetical protein